MTNLACKHAFCYSSRLVCYRVPHQNPTRLSHDSAVSGELLSLMTNKLLD